jgi:hypothetical protein
MPNDICSGILYASDPFFSRTRSRACSVWTKKVHASGPAFDAISLHQNNPSADLRRTGRSFDRPRILPVCQGVSSCRESRSAGSNVDDSVNSGIPLSELIIFVVGNKYRSIVLP